MWRTRLVLAFLILAAQKSSFSETLNLNNGIIKVKVDLDSGGAITYLSESDSTESLINNYDRGRQIQQSYYAGAALNRISEGQHPSWSPWPWNPIQVGDVYGNSAAVLESNNEGGIIFTKTVPMLWDMNNEPAEALFEQWTQLNSNTVQVRCKLTCHRTDSRWDVRDRHQEMPAVYTISKLCNQYTYVGYSPWTRAPLTKIDHVGPPWTYWGIGTARPGEIEGWAANVDDSNWGVGVFYKDAELFIGGLSGTCGGGEFDVSTTYLAPLRTLALEKDTVLDWEYAMIVGTLSEIRDYVYSPFGPAGADIWEIYH